jgi:hypothetical protein
MADNLTLRVAGLGHSLTLDMDKSSTVGALKEQVERETDLPAGYQRLVARGKKLDDDSATLASLGIEHRTKLMLLHNEFYAADEAGVTAISALTKAIDALAANADSTSPVVIHEFVTQICCKLDAIDTNGSDKLRTMRKNAIAKAEALDISSSSKDGHK